MPFGWVSNKISKQGKDGYEEGMNGSDSSNCSLDFNDY